MTEAQQSELLDAKQAARYLGISPRTLAKWHKEKAAPPRIKVSKKIYYRKAVIDAWLDAKMEKVQR